MKTLFDLNLEKHQTSNYADYVDKKNGLICCGWMDIHEDSNNLGDSRNSIFEVNPVHWDEKAVFIIKPRLKWYQLSLSDFLNKKRVPGIKYKGDSFLFDATLYHGLVPVEIARSLSQNIAFERSDDYKNFVKECDKKNSPKLVWKWSRV